MPSPLTGTIQTFWHGPSLPLWETLCLSSFLPFGHDVVVYTYNADLQVPEGIRVRPAGEILEEKHLFFYNHGSGRGSVSGFTNLFRYALLHKLGGWWIDTDLVCLKPFPAPDRLLAGHENAKVVNGAVIYSPPGNELMKLAFRQALDAGADVKWGETGPKLLTGLLRGRTGEECERLAPEQFYPVSWKSVVPSLLLPEHFSRCAAACRNSLAVHLYTEVFRRYAIPKDLLPPQGSYLARLFEAGGSGNGRAMDEAFVRKAILKYYLRRGKYREFLKGCVSMLRRRRS